MSKTSFLLLSCRPSLQPTAFCILHCFRMSLSSSITSDLSIPLIIQPQAFCFFSSIAWSQCLHYHSNWSRKASISVVFISWAVGGAVEAGLVFGCQVRNLLLSTAFCEGALISHAIGCQALQDRGNEKMNLALGIIAAVFVAGQSRRSYTSFFSLLPHSSAIPLLRM